jgi:CubicO group peptidase (beta-lactamase class C family)
VFLCVAVTAFAQDTARMEQVIQSYVKAGTFMGTVLVARDGKIVLNRAYGSANLEWDVPNTTTTKFRLGSITKQFTAASILLLEERGKLKIDDRVKTYIADAPPAWDRITLFNLLTHSAGIPNFTSLAEYNKLKFSPSTPDLIIAAFKDKPLDFGPGEEMRYSNSGYLVLGSIIEKLSGGSYAAFVTDNIFKPLGMNDSGYDSNSAIIPHRANGYIKGPVATVNAGYINMTVPHAAGALYSTTEDLLQWEQALFAGKVVSPASLERMTTPFKNDYAFGLLSRLERDRRVISHNGGIDGFNTSMAYYPDTRTNVIVLSNVNGPVPDTLVPQLGALMLGDTVTLTSERKEISLPVTTLSRYVGSYELTPAATMTIALDGSQLTAQLTGQGKNPIFAESERSFFLKVVDAQIEFITDNAGSVTHLVLHQNGRETKAAHK